MTNNTIFNQAKDERHDTILNVKTRNYDTTNTTNNQANNEKQKTRDGG